MEFNKDDNMNLVFSTVNPAVTDASSVRVRVLASSVRVRVLAQLKYRLL